jgi:hypothetical protein
MEKYAKCSCQYCDNDIEFDANELSVGEIRQAVCPHCGLETNLFIPSRPSPKTPPKLEPKPKQKPSNQLRFKNPANGYVESVEKDLWIYVLLFGCFYFAAKGVWTHAVAGALAAICTCCISWIIYPFFANDIMIKHYLRKGWIQVNDHVSEKPN